MTGSATMTGRVFNNRYQITERIGIGGMAEVYRAQDNVLGRTVAVKVMLPQYAADPAFKQRFRQEAAAAANLQSPYIVNVYDWGQDDGTYYIVMELVRGSDLKTAIVQRGAINQRKVAEIGSQVCQALAVAHHQDIIHRDIKPQNIMVQPDGNVKVMDFGIARAKNSVKTQTSSVLGTAHYISPEQAQGKELTAASDIYSLGIVLYEAATGKLPFDAPDAVSVAMKQVNEEPALPSEVFPGIDRGLEAIIVKALQKNPADRFATANDMRLALNDYLAGRPVKLAGAAAIAGAAAVGLGGAAAGMTGAETRVMGPVSDAADGTMVMPGGVKPVTTSGNTPKNYHDEPGGSSKKKTVGIIVGIIVAIAVIAGIAFAVTSGGSGDPVPDVTGKTVDEATQLIEDAGFVVGRTDAVHDDKVAEGSVVSQDPKANTKHPKGTKINLTVSQGTEEITVPDFTNMTADDAKKEAAKLGLSLKAGTPAYNDDVEKDKICSQDPKAGETVGKGAVITYVVSLGTEKVAVPNVVGKSEGDAKAELKNAGFEVTVEERESDSVDKGKVISQNPSANESLAKGGTVNIIVSSGKPEPKQSQVPNVVGDYIDTAKSRLTSAGFKVGSVTKSPSNEPEGDVISQDPSSGTYVEGTTVNLVVSSGPSQSNGGNNGGGNNNGQPSDPNNTAGNNTMNG